MYTSTSRFPREPPAGQIGVDRLQKIQKEKEQKQQEEQREVREQLLNDNLDHNLLSSPQNPENL
jgi:hypothetical protein